MCSEEGLLKMWLSLYGNKQCTRSAPVRGGHILFKKAIVCWVFVSFLLSVGVTKGFGQYSNLRTRFVSCIPLQRLDTLSIAPPLVAVSDSMSGLLIDPLFYSLRNDFLLLDTAAIQKVCPGCKTLRVRYRVFPFNFATPVRRLDTLAIRRVTGYENNIAFDYSPYEPQTALLAQPGLRSNGSYTRGLSFGNNQNLVFNSNLNLQLDGKLGNDLLIRGALSDNSIPLQPDGTTRQLQEFDRIFIELERKKNILTAGDFDLIRPAAGYFSNYFKRLQGAKVFVPATPAPAGTKGLRALPTPTIGVAAGISKGRFARQLIQGSEGNQGPYRLQGAEGERFIIVLANTEKVFADGVLLRRGLEDDYIIDYNLGEITFLARRLITKDVRIIVEFEYAVQNYLRSTMAAQSDWALPRARIWLNMYSEQDSRNGSGAQDLSPAQRARLAQVGDTLRNAFASGVDTLESFDASRVLYRETDTLLCNGLRGRILVYSTADTARFSARFSEVPFGQGNYVVAPNAANGRVFRWVAPDPITCQPGGNFEPVIRLIAPEQRQLHTVGADFAVTKRTQVTAEAALSKRDLNRFSPINGDDDLGGAAFVKVRHAFFDPKKNTSKGWQLALQGDYEATSTYFQALNPYRPAEFVRDWNVNQITVTGETVRGADRAAEQIIKSGLVADKKDWGSLLYEFGSFRRSGIYDGQKHLSVLKVKRRGWAAVVEWNDLQTKGLVEKTRFERPRFDFSKTLVDSKKKEIIKLGVYAERERNTRRDVGADTLNRSSFWYDMARLYVQMPENQGRFQAGGFLSRRNDYYPVRQSFVQNTSATDLNINGRWESADPSNKSKSDRLWKDAKSGLNWIFTYRTLAVLAPEWTTLKPQNTYLGRLDYNLTALKNAFNLTTGYELGSGQTPKVAFTYLQVNPGQGQYAWIDRNNDAILQLDEMEISVFEDQAAYVRVAVTTTEYQRTNNVLFNQNLRFEPRLLWTKQKGWQKTARRFSVQSTWQMSRRVLADVPGVSPWNPFQQNIVDTALVGVNATLRNVLFVNRADPRWDASISQNSNQSRSLLNTGIENRQLSDWILHTRANLGKQLSIETDLSRIVRSNDSENFNNRDYTIQGWEISPKCTWLPVKGFRLLGKVSFKERQNQLGEREESQQTDYNFEVTWNPTAKPTATSSFRAATSLRAKFTLADIRYTGPNNTPVSFAILEGLQNGRNLLWSCTLDRQLSKSMQLNLSYEGRRTGGSERIIHIARAQVRAIF